MPGIALLASYDLRRIRVAAVVGSPQFFQPKKGKVSRLRDAYIRRSPNMLVQSLKMLLLLHL
jgi:hypothetical protein